MCVCPLPTTMVFSILAYAAQLTLFFTSQKKKRKKEKEKRKKGTVTKTIIQNGQPSSDSLNSLRCSVYIVAIRLAGR